jgi:hypothetical protein
MRNSFAGLLALGAALLAAAAGCSGGGNGSASTFLGELLAPTFKSSPEADLSGQQSVFQGTLEHGTIFTFPAIQNVTYVVNVNEPGGEDLVLDVFSRDGSELKSKTFTQNVGYFHAAVSQHVLCILRPSSVFDTTVQINSVTVTGLGNYSQKKLQINIILAGDDFSGFGNFNDLAAAQDRQNLAATLAQRVQALHDANSTGITVGFEGFSLTTAQVKATHPELVDSNGHTICHTQPEQVNSQGFSDIDTSDLDKWGDFGFPSNAPDTNAANGLDCFIIHHFANDGTVGLSPRPGNALAGNGPGSALCVGAFLQVNGQVSGPRSVDDMGVVLTHEIGHFLGLLHTTTFSPNANENQVSAIIDDGLSDSPAAGDLATLKANATANGHTAIGIGDGCADEPYIMFYQGTPSQQTFSPRQVSIMKTTLSAMAH